VSPSMIVFCKVFWKMHVFMYCRRKLTLGPVETSMQPGKRWTTWQTRGRHVVIVYTCFHPRTTTGAPRRVLFLSK